MQRAPAETAQIMRLCRRIEATADAFGWGGPEQPNTGAFVLYAHEGSDLPGLLADVTGVEDRPIVSGRVAAVPWLDPAVLEHSDVPPPVAYNRIAFNFTYGDPELVAARVGEDGGQTLLRTREVLGHPSIVGHAFRFEAWALIDVPGVALGVLGGKHLRHRPASREIRVLTACDTAGRVYHVNRQREGNRVELELSEPDEIGGRGNVETAVRVLADLAGGRCPEVGSDGYFHRYPDAPGSPGSALGGGREWRPYVIDGERGRAKPRRR